MITFPNTRLRVDRIAPCVWKVWLMGEDAIYMVHVGNDAPEFYANPTAAMEQALELLGRDTQVTSAANQKLMASIIAAIGKKEAPHA